MAASANLRIDQGATFRGIGTVKNPDGTTVNADGTTPLTNATSARMQIRPAIGSSTVTLEIDTTSGGLTITPAASTIALLLTAAQTSELIPAGSSASVTLVYDILVTFENGDLTRVFQGNIFVSPAVTM